MATRRQHNSKSKKAGNKSSRNKSRRNKSRRDTNKTRKWRGGSLELPIRSVYPFNNYINDVQREIVSARNIL